MSPGVRHRVQVPPVLIEAATMSGQLVGAGLEDGDRLAWHVFGCVTRSAGR